MRPRPAGTSPTDRPTDRRCQPAGTYLTAVAETGRLADVVLHRLPADEVSGTLVCMPA